MAAKEYYKMYDSFLQSLSDGEAHHVLRCKKESDRRF